MRDGEEPALPKNCEAIAERDLQEMATLRSKEKEMQILGEVIVEWKQRGESVEGWL